MRGKRYTLKQCSLGNFFVHVKLQSIRRKLPSCARVFGCVAVVSAIANDVLPYVGKRMGHKVEISFSVVCLFTCGKNGYVGYCYKN